MAQRQFVDPIELRKKILKRDISERDIAKKEREFQLKKTFAGRKKLAFAKAYETSRIVQAKKLPKYYTSKTLSNLGRSLAPQTASGGMFENINAPAGRPSGGTGRGRGRPTGTYTYQIPGVGPVPIQAYKRWLTQQKVQARLQNELAKVRMSAQPAMQEMPSGYGQYDSEDAFLDQPVQMPMQMQPQMRGYPQQMPQQQFQAQRPSFGQRIGGFLSSFAPQQQMQPRPPMSAGTGPVQRMSVWGNGVGNRPENNILNTPNIFNRRGDTRILFGGQ